MKIEDLDERVSAAKSAYNEALKRLEEISEEIHRLRKEREGASESPAGSEVNNVCSGAASSVEEDPMDDVINRFNGTGINSTDEYMEFPQKMSVKSSPVRQKKVGELDCPHMFKDFKDTSSTTVGQMVSLLN